jgi:hypothetical protein
LKKTKNTGPKACATFRNISELQRSTARLRRNRVGQAILPAAGFSAGPVKMRIRLEKPAEKPAAPPVKGNCRGAQRN